MKQNSRILVLGARGMVGSAIVRHLGLNSFSSVLAPNRDELDLLSESAVEEYFRNNKPEFVFLAAAKVGGIAANSKYPVEFLTENIRIQTNVISACHKFNVLKLLFLGSSCIYPKFAKQPITEDQLLSGPLEPTNDAYAIAKIAGIKLCQAYRTEYGANFVSAMPTNLYGIGDNYHLENSHVVPALIRRFHEAKIRGLDKVEIWGTGKPRREFLFCDDLAEACVVIMKDYNSAEIINVGTGIDVEIRELAEMIKSTVGYVGHIVFDESKPDGTPRKVLNIDKIKSLGWRPKTDLNNGFEIAYKDFLAKSKNENHSPILDGARR